ncbi:glutamate racemase [Haematospirillum jordaniae]|uniref:glutamate racemase n=1 Tax=Haematospirillum jordaniae TaxID=1549855 RepID=UPI00143314B3|nr:glutamate racemase [Haematospirillum jordaniae]NKD85783.1 glutamate racemase [Haematospirillum jordaniae]
MTRILVFDSGLGGLSVVPEIRLSLPGVALTYAADAAFFPYGDRDPLFLRSHLVRTLGHLIETERPDVVVIACNTASTLALDTLRDTFSEMAFVGTVPALKPAAQGSRSGVIGLLATPGTITSPYIDALKQKVAPDCILVRHGTARLAAMAEAWLRGDMVKDTDIAEEAAPLFQHPDLDTVVLGCTHYPLLRHILEDTAPRPVIWLDSGAAIARQTARLAGPVSPGGPDRALVSRLSAGYEKAMTHYSFPAPIVWDINKHPAVQDLASNHP